MLALHFDLGLEQVVPADHGALLAFACRCLADVDADGTVDTFVTCMRQLQEHGELWQAGKARRARLEERQ